MATIQSACKEEPYDDDFLYDYDYDYYYCYVYYMRQCATSIHQRHEYFSFYVLGSLDLKPSFPVPRNTYFPHLLSHTHKYI